jgi:hypothetical protein
MSTQAEPDHDSVNARLADFICSRKEEMIRAWISRVTADRAVPSSSLTTNQLRNHLPRLFDDLADILRDYNSDGTVRRAERDAKKHGEERWEQGFSLVDLLREVMHLRGVFIYHLRVFEEMHSDFGTPARLFASSTVHQFLDELAIDAAERFLASEKTARRDVSGLKR